MSWKGRINIMNPSLCCWKSLKLLFPFHLSLFHSFCHSLFFNISRVQLDVSVRPVYLALAVWTVFHQETSGNQPLYTCAQAHTNSDTIKSVCVQCHEHIHNLHLWQAFNQGLLWLVWLICVQYNICNKSISLQLGTQSFVLQTVQVLSTHMNMWGIVLYLCICLWMHAFLISPLHKWCGS